MISGRAKTLILVGILASTSVALWAESSGPPFQDSQAAAGSAAKTVGTVKAIAGDTLTLATDTGSTVSVLVQDSTRILRVAPEQKDLKNAAPMQLRDVQVGDRVLIRGRPSDDGKSIVATSAIVMKEEDVAAKQQREREDWTNRGVGGLVSAVDGGSGAITLSATTPGTKPVTIRVSKGTVIRRYAPDSVKFDDAVAGTLDQIKPGDQVRARGTRSRDGAELAADEIVSGTFRNIAGTVTSVDADHNTVNVMDLATKKPVALKISSDSQMRQLPLLVAQRIAARLKGQTPETGQRAGDAGVGAPGAEGTASAGRSEGQSSSGTGGARPNGPPDFQQVLNRMPAVTLADLHKGDAVMIVSTEGSANAQPTAITLLTGVEPILTAAPNGERAAMLLSPWNLGGGGSEAAAGTTP
jgi:hypothetical protein